MILNNNILNLVYNKVLIKTERKSWGKITGHTDLVIRDQAWEFYVGGPRVSHPTEDILQLIRDQIKE